VSDKTDPQAATGAVAEKKAAFVPRARNPLRRLYNWVLHWAETPYGAVALFLLAFAESSFFPIPPDVLLIALALGARKKAFKFALICTVGSITGAVLGYVIGYAFHEVIGREIIAFYHLGEQFETVTGYYRGNAFWLIWLAGVSPIPYKVFTIAAGIFERQAGLGMFSGGFWTLILASSCSRTLRFFVLGLLMFLFGARIKGFIDKYFNLLTLIFGVLIVVGFIVIRYLM
jgi:membrane protein YqaA with SNARE-associated domain